VLFQSDRLANNAIASALSVVSKRLEIGMAENDVSGVSCTDVPETGVTEPDWYRNGDAWVKIFLEPIAPGKFKQFDHVYDVPGENEFPKERWSSAECIDGFHITRRRDVWCHLDLHDLKSAYIAEVVSMGDEFYDTPYQRKRKVRVVTFGPVVPLTEVLGKHLDDFNEGEMLEWSVRNNHIEMVKLAVSKISYTYSYNWAFEIALVNGNDQIAEFVFENYENDEERQEMLKYTICRGRVDLVKRLMENTSVNASFFQTASVNGQFEIFELLRAKYGDPKCSDITLNALRGGNVNILKYIKSGGLDMTDFGMFVYACTYSPLQTVEYLVSEGADVKHPLIAYIAKKHAYEEVRKFLLDHFEDKSEVPRCGFLEREITNNRIAFIRKIEGEFKLVAKM
jgi:hypothetical protein